MTRPFTRTVRVGVALGVDGIVAALPGSDPAAPWVRALTPPADGGAVPPDLAEALDLLHRAAVRSTGRRCALHVALLPPLAQLRRIELPGLGVGEARRVLQRDPSRHFPVVTADAPLELEVAGEGWRSRSPFTLAAVPRALVEGIHAAARRSGWLVEEIVPAESAWAAGAPSLLPDATGDRALVVTLADRVEVLRVRDDRIVALRRLPGREVDVSSIVASLLGVSDPSRVATVGSPPALAARFAPRAAGPALLSEAGRAELRRRATRRSAIRFAAAAAMLTAAAWLDLWGVSRERSRLAGERERLRPAVAGALATRDTLARTMERLAALRAVGEGAPRMSALIASLSAELPDDAWVVSLRAAADTVHLEGAAAHAAPVFDALTRVSGLRGIRPDGPIRQEVAEDGTTTEHYSLTALARRAP